MIVRNKNEDFFKSWSREMAYVLGFFLADGCIFENPRSSKYIDFHNTDYELLKNIRNVMNSNHKITVRKRKDNWSTIYRFQIGSKEMFRDLLNLGMIPNKSKEVTLPRIPLEYLSDFTRGYFDGDGNIWKGYSHKNDRPSPYPVLILGFTSGSKNLLKELRDKLQDILEVSASIKYLDRAYRLHYSTFSALKIYHFLYDNLSNYLYMKRKKKVFDDFIKIHGGVV
jgi:intein/homing endonuclease